MLFRTIYYTHLQNIHLDCISLRRLADLGFLCRAKCLTGTDCWPATDNSAPLLRYKHSIGIRFVSVDFLTANRDFYDACTIEYFLLHPLKTNYFLMRKLFEIKENSQLVSLHSQLLPLEPVVHIYNHYTSTPLAITIVNWILVRLKMINNFSSLVNFLTGYALSVKVI